MSTQDQTTGVSFFRRRSTRVAVGVASVAGFTLMGAVPAFAATDADCTAGNTVDAGAGGTPANIQTLLDADTAVICLSGTFTLTTELTFDHTLTLYGLSSGVLDGADATQLISGSGDLTVQNLTLQNGSADIGGAFEGNSVTVIDSLVQGNNAILGGAIAADNVSAERSTFTGNRAQLGGAIFAYSSVDTYQSTFYENEADFGGAVFGYDYVSIDSSTFDDNFAGIAGGAVLVDEEISVQNSTFVSNSTEEAEGGALVAGYGVVFQSTFMNNTSGGEGDAVGATDGDVDLRGNIFVGESTGAQLGTDEGSELNDLGGNVFSTESEPDLTGLQASTLVGQSVATVFAGATLADNGGPTETVALYAESPAVNAVPVGEPSVTVDQRGVARDALSDSGAYEFQGAVSPAAPVLAATGSTTDGWVAGAAGLLLAAGGVMLAAVRRRRA